MVRRRQFRPGIVATVVRQFEQIGYQIRDGGYICPETSPRLSDRRFREMFGCSSTVCANAWLLIMDGWNDKPSAATKDRFLWALSLLKSYDTEGNLSCNAGEGCDEKTFRHWAWFFLEELSQNHVEIVRTFAMLSNTVLLSFCHHPHCCFSI